MKISIPRKETKSPAGISGFLSFFTVEFASLSILEVFIFLAVAGTAVYLNNLLIKNQFQSNGVSLIQCQADMKQLAEQDRTNLKYLAEQNSYDRVKLGDTTNILLALKDFNFDNGDLPQKLSELNGNYLNGNTIDAQYNKEYYYKKISNQDYCLCVYLSTGVWGTNKNQCPTKEDYLAAKSDDVPAIRLDKPDPFQKR